MHRMPPTGYHPTLQPLVLSAVLLPLCPHLTSERPSHTQCRLKVEREMLLKAALDSMGAQAPLLEAKHCQSSSKTEALGKYAFYLLLGISGQSMSVLQKKSRAFVNGKSLWSVMEKYLTKDCLTELHKEVKCSTCHRQIRVHCPYQKMALDFKVKNSGICYGPWSHSLRSIGIGIGPIGFTSHTGPIHTFRTFDCVVKEAKLI